MPSSLQLRCALCGLPSTDRAGAVQPCANGCGRQTEAVPYEPPMNDAERARRAETLGGDLAFAAAMVTAALLLSGTRCGDLPALQRALDAWAAHRARLDRQGVPK